MYIEEIVLTNILDKVKTSSPPLLVLPGHTPIKQIYWENISIMYVEEFLVGKYIGQSENKLT